MRNEAENEYEQMCAELDHLRECDKTSRKRITELEEKLDRVRGLPEKWREDEDACAAWEQWRNGEHCANELEAALGDEDE